MLVVGRSGVDDRGLVAIAVSELRRSGCPRAVVERGVAPRCPETGPVVAVPPGRAKPDVGDRFSRGIRRGSVGERDVGDSLSDMAHLAVAELILCDVERQAARRERGVVDDRPPAVTARSARVGDDGRQRSGVERVGACSSGPADGGRSDARFEHGSAVGEGAGVRDDVADHLVGPHSDRVLTHVLADTQRRGRGWRCSRRTS